MRSFGLLGVAVAFVLSAIAVQAADNEILLDRAVLKLGKRPSITISGSRSEGIVKGADGSTAGLSAMVEVFYEDGSTSGSFNLPSGPNWIKNDKGKAIYKDRKAALDEVLLLKIQDEPASRIRARTKGLGGLDISNPPPTNGVHIQVTFVNPNDPATHRYCARFSAQDGSGIAHRVTANGTTLRMIRGVGAACKDACADGALNGSETDVDCGGPCPSCPTGSGCLVGPDCAEGVCVAGICAAPTCSDGVQNGSETGTDCGAGCPTCPAGTGCTANTDCTSGVCAGNVCQAPTCNDSTQNQDETDVDCGGATCNGCPTGGSCSTGSDCAEGVCTAGTCAAPVCSDGVENGTETDIDCGGASCPTCPVASGCLQNSDCTQNLCFAGVCLNAFCGDLTLNGDETDVDCGGSCPPCDDGELCAAGSDCTSGICTGGTCDPPSCSDGVTNGNESDIDCGGGSCPLCVPGDNCLGPQDCDSTNCVSGTCVIATCTDGIKNGFETDTDCGGDIFPGPPGPCSDCAFGDECLIDSDCQTTSCAGTCTCGNQTHNFSIGSNNGGSFDPAEWPGGNTTHVFNGLSGICDVTIDQPGGNLDLVGTLGDAFNVVSFNGFSNCFGTGGEDGDGCQDNGCPPVGFGSCESGRPSCSAALNGSGGSRYNVQCVQ